jgi:hypothetical protein
MFGPVSEPRSSRGALLFDVLKDQDRGEYGGGAWSQHSRQERKGVLPWFQGRGRHRRRSGRHDAGCQLSGRVDLTEATVWVGGQDITGASAPPDFAKVAIAVCANRPAGYRIKGTSVLSAEGDGAGPPWQPIPPRRAQQVGGQRHRVRGGGARDRALRDATVEQRPNR